MAEPMYRHIAEDLRTKIESGELEHGVQLATEAEPFMKQYAASRNTVRDAIKWLTTLGIVETRPGQGTFVVEKINPFSHHRLPATPGNHRWRESTAAGSTASYVAEVAASGRIPTSEYLRVEIQRATPAQADALRIEDGAQVVELDTSSGSSMGLRGRSRPPSTP